VSIDFNSLQQCIDDTYVASRNKGGLPVSTESVKAQILGANKIKVVYTTVVNFVRDSEVLGLKEQYSKLADVKIESFVKYVMKSYKELTDSSLKMDQVSSDYILEPINFNGFNGARTSYWKRIVVFELKE